MSLTRGADLYGSIHENGLNKFLEALMAKRPWLFNYGSLYFMMHPEEALFQPLQASQIQQEDPISVPGTDNGLKIHYILQIANLGVDLYPKSLSDYPPEISVNNNEAVLCGDLGLTIAHPANVEVVLSWGEKVPKFEYTYQYEIIATNLKVWVRMSIDTVNEPENPSQFSSSVVPKLHFSIEKIELEDVLPTSLEGIIEVLAKQTIQYGLLERIKLPLKYFVFDMLSVSPNTDISPNPAIDMDQGQVWLDANLV